ncbi:16S rRNA (uracil(1498)-N(3))-methyltransferase, partial [Aerococcus urinae]
NGSKASKGKAKWESVVRAAAKQARRAWIPSVGDVVNSKALATWVEANTAAGGKVLICHEEATESLSSIIASDPTSFTTASSLTLVV